MTSATIKQKKSQEKLLEALAAGNTIVASATLAGVNRQTYYDWQKNDPTFAARAASATAEAEARNVSLIQTAAQNGSWQAAAWWLERRRHEDWRKREEVQQAGSGGGPLRVVVEYVNRAPDGDGDGDDGSCSENE